MPIVWKLHSDVGITTRADPSKSNFLFKYQKKIKYIESRASNLSKFQII